MVDFKSYKKDIPSIIEYGGYQIKEFPINTTSVLGKKWIFFQVEDILE